MTDEIGKPKRKKRTGLQGAHVDPLREREYQEDREYIVPVLWHALQVIEVLRAKDTGLKLEEIHQTTGIAKSTVYRIVRTLVAKRYVARDQQSLYKWSSFSE
ncbi:helix-turn-helix domain-containing protein [Granulicella paludicola]|uniref:helix-turn-helix domain-containing protein n=1 Tax=Granulicella paludicola TaxID=474951 RepID=UPI0021E0291A|nr:helix-turn-helix domain-containing protein [Granulicella paludicola]